ncbi:MAG: hypothetical protein IKB80_02870 [Oscillospiraceae bacterium]|nr:hypothetical protein [Oscillospiraceae bacterium]
MKKIKNAIIVFWNRTVCLIKHVGILINNIYRKADVKTDFIDLAPTNDVTECTEHIKALQWAITNPRVKNIALTGPYGSGKSSIIQTFLQSSPVIGDKSIQISLATFSDKEGLASIDIEEGILKQLFYKVQQRDIPQSRYRKIHRVSYGRILFSTILVALFTAVVMFVFWPSAVEFVRKSVVEAGNKLNLLPWFALLVATVLLIAVILVLAKIVQLCVCRVSVKDVKLPKEVGTVSIEPKESEILNKKVDEIIYFFEETSFRVVFFEDLDRFDDPSVFVKLREINTLLNNYDAIKEKVVFVYAIKDEMFTGTERTKFFDFIIPVIPIINSTNSGEILSDLLQVENGISTKHSITQDYIFDVAPFISDMRVLYNIYNEFLLYKQTIKINQGLWTLDDKILMSLIIFKNLQPDQFALLQNEAGLVKSAFGFKSAYINRRKAEIKNDIDEHKRVLDDIDHDVLDSKNELKYAMLCAITDWDGMAYSLTRNGSNTIYASNILNDDFDLSTLLQPGQWNIRYTNSSGSNTHKTISDLHTICTPYIRRFNYLQHSAAEEKTRRKNVIEKLNLEVHQLSTLSLQKLIHKFGSETIFFEEKETTGEESKELKEIPAGEKILANKLLEFLLRKGYINEEYANYINYFKGNSLTIADINFIMSIKTQKPKDFSYSLSTEKLDQLIAKLQVHEFSERAILNFDLLEHMLSCHNYDDKLAVLMQQLANGSRDSWSFINEFIDKTDQDKRFVRLLADAWQEVWDDIYHNHILTYDRKIKYLNLFCFHLKNEQLCALNKNQLMTRFFVENEDILQKILIPVADKMEAIIPALNISFTKLDITNVSRALLDFIFDNCYYEINPDMISTIVTYKNPSIGDSLNTQNYTVLLNLGYQPLLDYVHLNFKSYIENVILREHNTKESKQSAKEMLDRCIDELVLCERIIEHIDFKLDSVTEACKNHIDDNGECVQAVWDILLNKNKVLVLWSGVYDYWHIFGLSESLLDYIKRNADTLEKKDATCLTDEFKESVILSEIDIETFTKILSRLRMDVFTIALEKINIEKLVIMVEKKSFDFTVADYEEMKDYAPDLCAPYILLNQVEYAEVIDQIILSAAVFESLVLNENLSIPIKEKIIERDGTELMTEKVANHLCKLDVVISREVFSTAWEMLNNTSRRKELLFRHLDILELGDFEKYLVVLEEPFVNLERRTYRHEEFIPDNEENRNLVDRLQLLQYLTSAEFETQTQYDPKREIPVIRCRVKAKQPTPVK